jgi:hypothetical protein
MNRYERTIASHAQRNRAADAAACAGDQSGFVFQR